MQQVKKIYKMIFLIVMMVILYSVNSCVAQSEAPEPNPPRRAKQTDVITVTERPQGWRIETASSVYQIAVARDGIVIPVYYGPRGQPL
ncbi:MAG: hypothetical protein ACYST5_22355, partial [Planctomycetota bacterium]